MPENELKKLVAQITLDAHGEHEQLWAFHQALQGNVALPAKGTVIGEPVIVVAFEYDGNQRRGLTAQVRDASGGRHTVAAADLQMSSGTEGARFLAAYRQWVGLPSTPSTKPSQRRESRPAGGGRDMDALEPLDMVVLSLQQKTARFRVLRSGVEITLRATPRRLLVPGEIVRIRPGKQGRNADNQIFSGKIESRRLDVAALHLVPLKLDSVGVWDPARHYWGDDGRPIDKWAKPLIRRGPRPQFEMEQVLPGLDPQDPNPDADPIGQAVDCMNSGDRDGAFRILMDLCEADLRCLDAHAHLGLILFDRRPAHAIAHYEVGFRIGELSLGKNFDGVLPWPCMDNRPFLRCMHGFGLCLWRLGEFKEARRIFDRMLWLNPFDNQGIRLVIPDLKANKSWKDSEYR